MKPSKGYSPQRNAGETFWQLLEGVARGLLTLGAIAAIGAIGLLAYYHITFSGQNPPSQVAQASDLIRTFSKILTAGMIAAGLGVLIKYWREEGPAGIFMAFGLLTTFIPTILSAVTGATPDPKLATTRVAGLAAAEIQQGGILGLILGAAALIIAVGGTMRDRIRHGAKADAMKYGKGVKAETIQNVLMGKCWQLPYCRKFVRERCPIFHAKRTCWKERVGCMCEESVIQNALQGSTIPKDSLTAAKYIPQNRQISLEQKKERCRQCVIYNEHQRHKYRVAVPGIFLGLIAGYLIFKPALLNLLNVLLSKTDSLVASVTFSKSGGVANRIEEMSYVKEGLLICLMFITLAYLLKLAEYLFFEKKI